MKPSLAPCFFSNTSLYCERSAMTLVMSTSLKVVSIAAGFCTSFRRRAMVWRSRRGRRGLGGSGCSSGRLGASGTVIDLTEQRTHRDRLAVLGDDLAEHAGGRRGHLDGDLVGLELDQRLVDRHGFAGLLEPA